MTTAAANHGSIVAPISAPASNECAAQTTRRIVASLATRIDQRSVQTPTPDSGDDASSDPVAGGCDGMELERSSSIAGPFEGMATRHSREELAVRIAVFAERLHEALPGLDL